MPEEFTPVDVSHLQAPMPQAKIGNRPNLGWVAIADLVIDRTYQRDMGDKNWRHVCAIAAKFDWGLFSTVDVGPAQGMAGKYAIIDGQHRVHAAALIGIDKVPCRVVAASRAGQARAFAAINGNVTAMTAFHIYKAALAGGEAWAVAADDICDSAGCRLMTYNRPSHERNPREIYAIAMVRSFTERPALRLPLYVGLAALSDSARGGQVGLWSGHVLRPWLAAVEPRNDLWAEKKAFHGFAHMLETKIDLAAMAMEARDDHRERRDSGQYTVSAGALLESRLDVALATHLPDRRALFDAIEARLKARRAR